MGIVTLIPVIVLLAVALITKKTISALILGAVTALVIAGKTDSLTTIQDAIYGVGMSGDTVWLLMIFVFIGAFSGVLKITGAADEMLKFIAKRVKSGRSLFLWTWIFGLVLFIDDVLRTTVLGQLTPLYDKYKIPRAAFAYMVDVFGVAFASLIPITSWAAFYMGVFSEYEEVSYLGTSFELYVHLIPFLLYSWIGLVLVFLFTMGCVPKLGAMKKAYITAEETGRLYTERSDKFNHAANAVLDFEAEQANAPATAKGNVRIALFVGAIIILTVIVFTLKDILPALIVVDGLLIAITFLTRMASWEEILDSIMEGVQDLYSLMIIVFAAYLMRDSVIAVGMPDYVISVMEPLLSPALFPALSFLACCILTFCTGSNWGITAVYATVGMPLCFSIGADPVLVMAAIVNGAAFGAHICFYTDMTVFVSSMCKLDNIEHALTQLPYGLIGGGLAFVAFAGLGFIM